MGRKPKFSKEVKIKACEDYKQGKGSFLTIASKIGCNCDVLRIWYCIYLEHGPAAFDYSIKNKSYLKDFKENIVSLYLSGNLSVVDISVKYNVSTSVIRGWVNQFNNGKVFKDYNFNSNIYNMKYRKSTAEEKIRIAKWVIENNMDYKAAADKFVYKYSNVYSWTNKYLSGSEEALKGHAGRPKKTKVKLEELSEVDRLKYELAREKELRKNAEFKLEVFKKKEEFAKARQSQR